MNKPYSFAEMIRMKKLMHIRLLLLLGILLTSLWTSCTYQKTSDDAAFDKEEFTKLLYKIRKDEDAIRELLIQNVVEENDYGIMLSYRQLGNYLRESARFSEAIAHHQEELDYAIVLNDTLEIIQALNNIGTDYRRIGALTEASDYHYRALTFAEAYSEQETRKGVKARDISLNGIGNVSLSLGFYDEAKKYFLDALEDAIILESNIGQAINYANIGAVYERKENYRLAKTYYTRSLEQNELAGSDMGRGLSYMNLGNLYRLQGEYEMAVEEYKKAYDLMTDINDKWHLLEISIGLSEVMLLKEDYSAFEEYIEFAHDLANEIKSLDHQSKIYSLKHDKLVVEGKFPQALELYKKGAELKDSSVTIQKNNQYVELRVNYEREKFNKNLNQIETPNRERESKKNYLFYILLITSLEGIVIISLLIAYRRLKEKNKKLDKDLFFMSQNKK